MIARFPIKILNPGVHVFADALIHGGRNYPLLQHIPQGFVKQIKGKLPNKATLADYTGRSWSVQLLEVGSRLFIKNGWEEFAADHSLAFGDFLVFCYHHSSSVFHVKIFGKNGCKKERACPANKAPFIIEIEDDDEEEVEERVEETRVRRSLSRPVRNCKRKYANLEIKELDSSCICQLSSLVHHNRKFSYLVLHILEFSWLLRCK